MIWETVVYEFFQFNFGESRATFCRERRFKGGGRKIRGKMCRLGRGMYFPLFYFIIFGKRGRGVFGFLFSSFLLGKKKWGGRH